MSFETENEREIICPYCFYKHSDSWECFDSGCESALIDCPICEKEFEAFVDYTAKYSTRKTDVSE